VFIYKYSRYYHPGERKHETLAGALRDAFDDHDEGMASGVAIVSENGNEIMNTDELFEFFCTCSLMYDKLRERGEEEYTAFLEKYAADLLKSKVT
jgi:hypothetical protein